MRPYDSRESEDYFGNPNQEQSMTTKNDPELLAAAQKGADAGVFREDGDRDPKPLVPSELVGRILYTKMDGAEREVGIVLDYTYDSVVVGVNRK